MDCFHQSLLNPPMVIYGTDMGGLVAVVMVGVLSKFCLLIWCSFLFPAKVSEQLNIIRAILNVCIYPTSIHIHVLSRFLHIEVSICLNKQWIKIREGYKALASQYLSILWFQRVRRILKKSDYVLCSRNRLFKKILL